jgi:hypothetical protein
VTDGLDDGGGWGGVPPVEHDAKMVESPAVSSTTGSLLIVTPLIPSNSA